jgi:hypothetical protein
LLPNREEPEEANAVEGAGAGVVVPNKLLVGCVPAGVVNGLLPNKPPSDVAGVVCFDDDGFSPPVAGFGALPKNDGVLFAVMVDDDDDDEGSAGFVVVAAPNLNKGGCVTAGVAEGVANKLVVV